MQEKNKLPSKTQPKLHNKEAFPPNLQQVLIRKYGPDFTHPVLAQSEKL